MIVARMKDALKKIDPTRPCTAAMNGSWGEGFTYAVDVQGSNYMNIGNMDEVHKKFPNLPSIFTEEASTLTTRGIYKTDNSRAFYQAYDREFPGWGCSAQQWMRYVDQRKYIAGAFVWTGFDYGGESAMHYWPGVVSNFGIMDYCGFPKDAFWYYKSCWQDEPVLHILPHWNGIGADSVEVQLYTNMQEVELFLNGKSLGSKNLEKYDIPSWKIKYVPGRLVAKGKRGKEKITTSINTTGKPSLLKISNETGGSLMSGNNDIAVLTVKVVDNKHSVVPTAENKIVFSVKNGRVLGVGNGHPSSQEKDVFLEGEEVVRNAFGGYAQIIVASDNSSKPVEVSVHSEGLTSDSITLK
jgi:beta-galactosidase